MHWLVSRNVDSIVGFDSVAVQHLHGHPPFPVAHVDITLVPRQSILNFVLHQKFISASVSRHIKVFRVTERIFGLTHQFGRLEIKKI